MKSRNNTMAKRSRCSFCNAAGGKKHASTCNRNSGSKQSAKMKITSGLTNKVALVIDRSGSMAGIANKTVEVVNDYIRELKEQAAKTGQRTLLTVYLFNHEVRVAIPETPIFEVPAFYAGQYYAAGGTALLDATGLATSKELEKLDMKKLDRSTSYLVITVTDGDENESRIFKSSFPALLQRATATDLWTFVFSVPHGRKDLMVKWGAMPGNVREWEQTEAGLTDLSQATTAGFGAYFATRSAGGTKTSTFFAPDLAAVPTKQLKALTDLSQDFRVWDVDRDQPIKSFVENQISLAPQLAKKVGTEYQIGRGYYQLTKTEDVQDGKDFAILDPKTSTVYGGDDARTLLKMPPTGKFKIKPGNQMGYIVFIKSTSINRKLIGGTKMLYRIN